LKTEYHCVLAAKRIETATSAIAIDEVTMIDVRRRLSVLLVPLPSLLVVLSGRRGA